MTESGLLIFQTSKYGASASFGAGEGGAAGFLAYFAAAGLPRYASFSPSSKKYPHDFVQQAAQAAAPTDF
jgi:hypothetical protein